MHTKNEHKKAPARSAASGQKSRTPFFQAKLTVNEPGDRFEKEADRAADHVMRMQEGDAPVVQRMPVSPVPDLQRKCAECEKEEAEQIRRKAEGAAGTGKLTAPPMVGHVLRHDSGQPMENGTRRFMESRFGQDFSQVQIHTGGQAATSAASIRARAYTHGQHIVFGAGEYRPQSEKGQRLLAHELAHTMQQSGRRSNSVQADFAVEPTTPNVAWAALTDAQVQDAIAFNQARHTDVAEVELLRDIVGVPRAPAVIDEDFVRAVGRYQAQFGLEQDGKIGGGTADRLAKEIIASADFLGPGNLGSLGPEFSLQTALQTLISADNRTYQDYKNAIQAESMIRQFVALNNQQLLLDLKTKLNWNNWARCIELLGRRAPTGAEMLRNANVRTALNAAWAASNAAVTIWPTHNPAAVGNACNPPVGGAPPNAAHEEGGFIYMHLVTGELSTRRVAAGAQAALTLANPPVVVNSIVVGGFHTHPNVGACWGAPFFSGADITWSATNGVPLLMRGAFPLVANTSNHTTGNARAHLAGNRGLPGAGGGLAPQATADGKKDLL